MKESNLTYEKLNGLTGLSNKTLQKIINRYDIDVSRKCVFALLFGLHQDFNVSKALLEKAGICKCNSLVSKVYWYILENINEFIEIDENSYDLTPFNINKFLKKKQIPEKFLLHPDF